MMNTAESTAEKDSTQSYFHLAYVKMPAIITKKEYHRRVSPKVLKGGREREIHNEAMNEANTSRPRQQSETAKTYFFLKGAKATRRARRKEQDGRDCKIYEMRPGHCLFRFAAVGPFMNIITAPEIIINIPSRVRYFQGSLTTSSTQ